MNENPPKKNSEKRSMRDKKADSFSRSSFNDYYDNDNNDNNEIPVLNEDPNSVEKILNQINQDKSEAEIIRKKQIESDSAWKTIEKEKKQSLKKEKDEIYNSQDDFYKYSPGDEYEAFIESDVDLKNRLPVDSHEGKLTVKTEKESRKLSINNSLDVVVNGHNELEKVSEPDKNKREEKYTELSSNIDNILTKEEFERLGISPKLINGWEEKSSFLKEHLGLPNKKQEESIWNIEKGNSYIDKNGDKWVRNSNKDKEVTKEELEKHFEENQKKIFGEVKTGESWDKDSEKNSNKDKEVTKEELEKHFEENQKKFFGEIKTGESWDKESEKNSNENKDFDSDSDEGETNENEKIVDNRSLQEQYVDSVWESRKAAKKYEAGKISLREKLSFDNETLRLKEMLKNKEFQRGSLDFDYNSGYFNNAKLSKIREAIKKSTNEELQKSDSKILQKIGYWSTNLAGMGAAGTVLIYLLKEFGGIALWLKLVAQPAIEDATKKKLETKWGDKKAAADKVEEKRKAKKAAMKKKEDDKKAATEKKERAENKELDSEFGKKDFKLPLGSFINIDSDTKRALALNRMKTQYRKDFGKINNSTDLELEKDKLFKGFETDSDSNDLVDKDILKKDVDMRKEIIEIEIKRKKEKNLEKAEADSKEDWDKILKKYTTIK